MNLTTLVIEKTVRATIAKDTDVRYAVPNNGSIFWCAVTAALLPAKNTKETGFEKL